ncbi:hypothetical protein [Anatilimnocola floriformis]|uniref:hypothetical protein n=1 Tax=Anatilimnocola floriformis TaxID=2948575 RepID=UPI0020C518AE|nr:hypothetical protein [Anatilimnocola floriformis]
MGKLLNLVVGLLALLYLGVCANSYAEEPFQFPAPREHLWNRLHEHLYVRIQPNGSRYVHENLEANFTPRANFLIEGDSHRRAMELLDEFLRPEAAHLSDDVSRAILQRDLWAVFAALSEPDLARQAERKQLLQRLAKAMRLIALPTERIEKLPDNFAAVARAQQFPAEFDPREPDKPFLPRDLFAADSSWVLLTNRLRPDASPAPTHDKATSGRSTFLLLLRLPAGRDATLAYLKDVGTKQLGRDELLQFPAGTQVALARRMNLLDETGSVHVSPLIESVQLRVYQELKAPNVFEFTLHRRALFDQPGNSLRAVARDEINPFDIGLLGLVPRNEQDPIENPVADPDRRGFGRFVMKGCLRCHGGPGIYGFQSIFVDHFEQPPLAAGNWKDQLSAAKSRAQKGASVAAVQRFWKAD